MSALEDARAALDDLRHGIPRRGEYPEYDREHDDIDKIDALIAEHERLAERLEEAYRIGADGWERATGHAAEAKRLTAELEQWKTTAEIRREAYVAVREDLKRLTAPPTDDEREALIDSMINVEVSGGMVEFNNDDREDAGYLADAILASDVWRNRRQGPITDGDEGVIRRHLRFREGIKPDDARGMATRLRAAVEAARSAES